ncbi:MAG: aspartate-semialdehyde dehydrogenase [Candidatus Omnitrophica bacterium]|nr:aspartate-semialdehyde dehydrogenase [Candidatus Omnitrophota bacterium]
MRKYNIAVVGVGAVGVEILKILKERSLPIAEIKVFARSERDIEVNGDIYSVKGISSEGFEGIDFALFAGTEGEKGASVTYAPEAIKRGAIVIDNGADFRLKPDVPLVVPEVNPQDIKKHKGLISNPNCSTIQLVVAIWPIYKKIGIKRIIITTFQAASGAGKSAVDQLFNEINEVVSNQDYKNLKVPRVLPQQLAFNLFPQIGNFAEFDYTSEEWKLVKETKKILHDDKIKITATCVRVPVKTGHSEAIYLETKNTFTVEQIKDLLSKAPGIKLIDEPQSNLYPMPKDAEGKDDVFVGRIRKDPFSKFGLWLWVVSDNLRKGAALNAIQILEHLLIFKK